MHIGPIGQSHLEHVPLSRILLPPVVVQRPLQKSEGESSQLRLFQQSPDDGRAHGREQVSPVEIEIVGGIRGQLVVCEIHDVRDWLLGQAPSTQRTLDLACVTASTATSLASVT